MDNWLTREEPLLSLNQIKKIQNTYIILLGLGGVGSWALEALVRLGYNNFTIVDKDTFEISNKNRQLFATDKTLGKFKCEVAKDRMTEINSKAKINTICKNIACDNVTDIFLNCDNKKQLVIVDAIDNPNSKAAIWKEGLKRGALIFSSMGAGFKTNPFEIKKSTLNKTNTCPLARRMRLLCKENNIPSEKINVIWSSEITNKTTSTEIASLVTVTATFGLMLASYILESCEK